MLEPDANTTRLSNDQRIDWLRLIRTENVGPVTFRKLLNRFGSAEAALDALPALSRRGGRSAPLAAPSRMAAEDELAAISKLGGALVAMGESAYSALLKHIQAPPPMITIIGGENLDWSRGVGIVGARNASAAGQRMTKLLASELGERGHVIISGLARGIDTAAHRASLSTGTVAVLAGGIDKIYPDENIALAHEILAHNGALITEMPLGWVPRARDFPRRNRLVSGLSLGVVVIEAAKRSGSLITARLALEQNREVFAVPGSPLDPRSQGTNSLIQQGATLVTDAQDIIDNIATADPSSYTLFEDDDDVTLDLDGFSHDEADAPSQSEQAQLLNALSLTPIAVDELVQQTGIPASRVQTILMELDLAGRLEWASGQLVSLCD